MPKNIIIRHQRALGDTVLLTALVRDIKRRYGETYNISVQSNYKVIWDNNPHITKFSPQEVQAAKHVTIEVGLAKTRQAKVVDTAGKLVPLHVLGWYHHVFKTQTGLHVPITEPKGDLHLTLTEKQKIISGRYWVIVAGGKHDITIKHWGVGNYQEVVNQLKERGVHCVQCGAGDNHHYHTPLHNVVNIVGKTKNIRDLLSVIYHAEGIICPVTAYMHLAAVFDKPCVVIAGGREEPWYGWYGNSDQNTFAGCPSPVKVPHKFLHTMNLLPCCQDKGCWKRLVKVIHRHDNDPQLLCLRPITLEQPRQAVAECMHLITPKHVTEAVMSFYDNVLPPIDVTSPGPITIPDMELEIVTTGNEPQLIKPLKAPTQTKSQTVPPVPLAEKKENHKKEQLYSAANPIIGGKFTVCVLCYGDHPKLAEKCINSIFQAFNPQEIELRIATNEASPTTLAYIESIPHFKHYRHDNNAKKYPVMREMFWDKEHPITTNYVLWFDDDTRIISSRYAYDLCQAIITNHDDRGLLLGTKMSHDIKQYYTAKHDPLNWFRSATWYRDIHLRLKNNVRTAPNGTCIDFCVGYHWAISTNLIQQANIPEPRLNHNGGDITIGMQVLQAGGNMVDFNRNKSLVWCPSRENGGRRGYSENFPWQVKHHG